MLVLSMILLGAFILMSVLMDNDIDDDGPDDGMLVPAHSVENN